MTNELDRSVGRRLFGLDAPGYAVARPGYPDALYDYLADHCGLREGVATLEIGPGGGQATAGLIGRGARPLVLVEPDRDLAAFLAARFGGRVEVRNETLEEASIAAASFDLVACATAFHWIDPERGLAQVLRALRPGGSWAMWWTVFHDPDEPGPLYHALRPILDDLRQPPQSGPTPADGFALDAEGRLADLAAAGFRDLGSATVRWTLTLDGGRARALFSTFSPILALGPAHRADVLDRIESVISNDFDGVFERTVLTVIYSGRL